MAVETFQNSEKNAHCNPENNPILERWAAVLCERGSDPAILTPQGNTSRTFRNIDEESLRWIDRLGDFAPGTVFALGLGNIAEWPALLLALWKKGGVVVPCEPGPGQAQLDRLRSIAGVNWLIEARGESIDIRSLGETGEISPRDFDLLKITSGTTGLPRAIKFTAAQLLADCDAVCDTMELKEDDINFGVVSFAHSYGFSNLITPLIGRGLTLVAAVDALPRAIMDGLARSRATVLAGVPAHFRGLSHFPGATPALRLCLSAGAPLPAETAMQFQQNWSRKVHSFYGASECGGICYDASERLDLPTGFVGEPMSGVTLNLLSREFPTPVAVRGAAVGQGYLDSDDPSLRAGCYLPSDLLEPCDFGFIVRGRSSDFINVAGRKVSPAEIESVLQSAPGVKEVVVLGLPAAARGEEVAACVVGDVSEDKLRQFCAEALPAWQVPKQWFFWESIPLNARGKISRADLRARILGS